MKKIHLLRLLAFCFLVAICGNMYAQKSGTKPKPKAKTSKSSSKEDKKFKPDPNYEKYMVGGPHSISNHLITINLISPLGGFATVGYQRKLSRHFLGEAGVGVGLFSSPLYGPDDFTPLNTPDFQNSQGTDLFPSTGKTTNHPKIELYGMLSYCFTGPLVNYNYGIGLYFDYKSIGIDWSDGKNETGTFNAVNYGIAIHSQTMLGGAIGLGWCAGIGVESTSVKNALFVNTDTGESAHKDLPAVAGFGFFGQLKLNVVL